MSTLEYCEKTDLIVGHCAHCSESKDESKGKLGAVRTLAEELMEHHGLLAREWSFSFDRPKRRVGQCNYSARKITMSKPWAIELPLEECRETILHEIAHALVGRGMGHGPVWRKAALTIGSRGERCADTVGYTIGDAPWEGTCPSCATTVSRYRAPTRVLACNVCSGRRFHFNYAFTWTKNGQVINPGAMPVGFASEYNQLVKQHA